MGRLTTDNPQGNFQWLHNMTTIKDGEVYFRDEDQEISLVEYCRQECKKQCDTQIDAGAERFGEYMDCECAVSRFYHMAVGYAELRAKLKQYEDGEQIWNELTDDPGQRSS